MSDKKRKSSSKDGERPSKKQQVTSSLRVSHIAGPEVLKPVVAVSPGVSFPSVAFHSFTRSTAAKNDLLLQSSEHSTLDYIAREDDLSVESHLKHYVAVYEPETGKLQVTEAKRMTVRTALRSAAPTQDGEDEDENTTASNYISRAALTAAFGTKKSKKAAQSAQENRVLAQGTEGADDPISNALLSNMAEDEGLEELSSTELLSNKPLPLANTETKEVDQVYSLDTLVLPSPATMTLETMPVNTWITRISKKKEVKTRFRFVASRVGYLAQKTLSAEGATIPKYRKALQVLRYIELLLDIHSYVKRLPRHKSILPFDKWPDNTMSDGTPLHCIRPIMNHIFPDRTRKDQFVTLLRTTILALALHIPPPSGDTDTGELVTEPTDLSLDMAIEASEAKKLYRELGCLIIAPTEQKLIKWGLERLAKKRKDESGNALPKPAFAILKTPPTFPKISKGRQSSRKL